MSYLIIKSMATIIQEVVQAIEIACYHDQEHSSYVSKRVGELGF